jgi:dihydrofolate reductase
MRKLVITTNMTLDGVVDQMDKWFSPTDGGEDLAEVNREQMGTTGVVLMGRTTYEEFKGFWPKQTDDKTGVTDYLNRTPKYVVSSTLTEADADWQNTIILSGPLADEIAALKNQGGADIVVSGSISLAQSLAQEHLVDEYRLFIYPTLLGDGRHLFTEGIDGKLQLTDTRTFSSGVVLLIYRRA